MYEAIFLPTVMYGSEASVMSTGERIHVEVVEIRCQRTMYGVMKYDKEIIEPVKGWR